MTEKPLEVIANRRQVLLSGAILVAVWASALALFEMRWHRSALLDLSRQWGGWAGALVVVAFSAVVHEMLHAGGWRFFGRLPGKAIAFQRTWQVMGIAARVVLPISLGAYRAGLALPFLLMGLLPIVLGTMTGNGLLPAWALFFSLECFSDLGTLLATRHLPADELVLSHPTRLGCRLASGRTT
jgi:hypothetical protein